jgi:protein-disulfide isomerase
VGATGDAFTSCVRDMKYQAWVEQVAATMDDHGITSTPTVFVGGKKLQPAELTPDGLEAAVAAAR